MFRMYSTISRETCKNVNTSNGWAYKYNTNRKGYVLNIINGTFNNEKRSVKDNTVSKSCLSKVVLVLFV